jgi:intracellular septation protein
MKQLTKIVLEIGPLVVFFLSNAYFGIFYATAAFMIATVFSLSVTYILYKKVAAMPLITGVFVMIFGGLTVYLQNDTFIKVKPTIVNCLFAGLMFGGLAFGRPLLKLLFQDVFQLRDDGWTKLTFRWGCFFVVLAVLNEIVWRNFSTDTWVSFKVFGIMPLTFIFAMSQMGLLHKYQLAKNEDADEREPEESLKQV